MDNLLELDRDNDYVLLYRDEEFLGRYSHHKRVEERFVPGRSKLLWDQFAVARVARKEKLDILFHTKFTVPLLFSSCPSVMTIHGASWFVKPELYSKANILYIRAFMPLYCRRASMILSNSQLTTDDFVRLLAVPREKIRTIPLGTSKQFRLVDDPAALKFARDKYRLPRNFILSVVKYDPRKNFANLIAAFRLLRKRLPGQKLVVIGIGCEKYGVEYDLDSDGTSDDVHFLGWIDNDKLPAIYSMARCLFFPSVYEEFGIPSCEAMACGCPPVVSSTGALPGIVGDSGLIVDPFSPPEMADALERICSDDELRSELSDRCLVRAADYTWERCARDTLDALNSLRDKLFT